MHVLWSMKELGLEFHLKGGTSLSKGYECIHRFSEDIDIHIKPDEELCDFKVYSGPNHDKKKHIESREKFFQWITDYLDNKIDGIIQVARDPEFDDPSGKYRNGGIRLFYDSKLSPIDKLKEGILLEVGFGKVTPYQSKNITSWAVEEASKISEVNFIDNTAKDIYCYEPKYTFVEKLQAIVRKFRLYKDEKNSTLPANFIRHYYDLYQLIDREDVQQFIGTEEYNNFKIVHFKGDDPVISNSKAFTLDDKTDRELFFMEYEKSENLYYKGRPKFQEIIYRMNFFLDKL